MPLVLGTLKSSKTDFHRSQHQKRKDEIRPFSILTDFNPLQLTKSRFIFNLQFRFQVHRLGQASLLG